MHHALEIQEILLNVFGHCYPPNTPRKSSNLAALARTCRAFKEPALDVLWAELNSLSPLVRCLPEASCPSSPDNYSRRYSFSRPLTQFEWDILRSYTRRIWSISIPNSIYELDWESIPSPSKPPTSEPLFPNLRHLYFKYTYKARPLFLLPHPSLISLQIWVHDPHLFEDSLQSFAKISPDLKTLIIRANSYAYTIHAAPIDMSKIDPNFICRWQNLQTVACYEITLDVNTLVYLSRMPALTQLCFTLSSALPDQITPSDSPLVFSNLHQLHLHSQSLAPVSRLLSYTRMAAITVFTTSLESRPSKQDVSSFLGGVQVSGIGHTILTLGLYMLPRYLFISTYNSEDPRFVLGFEDLQPCMAFSNLHQIIVDIDWKVDLADSELLTLALAWPYLDQLSINAEWGWKMLGGITPNGLLQVLQKCPSLSQIALAIDTRGYTRFHQSPAILGLTLPRMFHINVVDSVIEAESVQAIAAFFTCIASRSQFSFSAWGPWVDGPDRDVCKARWDNVRGWVNGYFNAGESIQFKSRLRLG